MFQTLVDVGTQRDTIMQRIFGSKYSQDKAEKLWHDANKFVFSYFHKMCEENEKFETVTSVFERCYTKLFPKYGVNLDPGEGAYILASAHADSLLYHDSQTFLDRIKNKYKTCVISDTDSIMIDKLLDQFSFDHVFKSEEFQAYKSECTGKLFNVAISTFGIQPHEMLHIGDGLSDIAGAKKAGADAAWINRNGKEWAHDIKPDYIVSSLHELPI